MSPVGISGPKRSAAFQAYLDSQTPQRVSEILAAERRYLNEHKTPGAAEEAAERDFAESMRGFRDQENDPS
jgi:hypothetical protein